MYVRVRLGLELPFRNLICMYVRVKVRLGLGLELGKGSDYWAAW